MRENMYCHNCGNDFSIDMDMRADGNHVFRCPFCRHEHCRVVKNGIITDDRWDQRNQQTWYPRVYTDTSATKSAYNSGTTNQITYDSWSTGSSATVYY